jgi:hypothetical protein
MQGFVRDALLAATQGKASDPSFPADVTGPMGAAYKAGVPQPMSLPAEPINVDLRPEQGGGAGGGGGGAGGGSEPPTYNDGSSQMGGKAGEPPPVYQPIAPVANLDPNATRGSQLVAPPRPPGAAPPPSAPGVPAGAIAIDKRGGFVHPGEVKPENLTPRYEELMKAAREAELYKASAQSEGARQQAAAVAEQESLAAGIQATHLKAQASLQAAQQKLMDDYNAVRQEMNEPAGQVDPMRWWKSRSNFQNIAFVLAAAFNPNFPALIQSIIRNDIDAQKANLEFGERRLEKRLGAANTAYEELRQRGADETTATHQATALLQEQLKRRLEVIAANTNSEVVKADAQLKLATFDKGILDSMEGANNHMLAQQNQAKEQAFNRYKFSVTHQGVNKGVPLKPSQAQSLADFKSAIDITNDLKSQFTGQGFGARMWASISNGKVGAQFKTAASQYETRRAAALRTIGLITDQSVLQKHDIEEWDRLLPHADDPLGAQKLDALVNSQRTKFDNRIQVFGQSGFNVSGFLGGPQQPSAPEAPGAALDVGAPVEE